MHNCQPGRSATANGQLAVQLSQQAGARMQHLAIQRLQVMLMRDSGLLWW